MQHSSVSLTDRLIAVGSYLTLGAIGIIWFFISILLLKKATSKFLMYNLIQSFILSITCAIFFQIYDIFIDILSHIPLLGSVFILGHIYLFETPIYHTLSLANFIIVLFLIYLSVFSFLGKLPNLPFITNIVKKIYG